ncbi:MAG: M20/M25/M40 family metallo-hydrolase [Armatimonadota bacterium]
MIAGSAVGAGVFLAASMPHLAGSIKVYGCPAEELGTGKPMMLDAGAFAGVDVALTYHPWHATALMECTGVRLYEFAFSGRPAHAATEPWSGASALDGVLLTYTNLNALRQFTPDRTRIHGIVTEGGQAVNVIPERAVCKIGVRSADVAELDRLCARVVECARAGALASGTRLEITETAFMKPLKYNRALGDIVRANLGALGESVGSWRSTASTDFGNVSQAVPAMLFSVATWPKTVSFHTHEAAVCAAQPQGLNAMLIAAHAMARTAADLLVQPDTVRRIKDDYARAE